MAEQRSWSCTVGEVESVKLPERSDGPMRDAVEKMYRYLTGEAPTFIFSGWGAQLDEAHRAVVEDRLPDLDVQIAEAREQLDMLLAVRADRDGQPAPEPRCGFCHGIGTIKATDHPGPDVCPFCKSTGPAPEPTRTPLWTGRLDTLKTWGRVGFRDLPGDTEVQVFATEPAPRQDQPDE